MDTRSNWELLLEAAQGLIEQGTTRFSRRQLLDAVRRHYPDRPEGSLGPTLQGMTLNAQGGPPSAGGKPFVRIGHGLYELHDPNTGMESVQETTALPARRERQEAGSGVVKVRLQAVIRDFPRYLDIYDQQYPFVRSGQWSNHADTIRMRRERGTVTTAINDDAFIAKLHDTLRSWGIGKRASRLAPLDVFTKVLRQHASELGDLEGMTIDHSSADEDETVARLWRFIKTAEVVDNRAKVVAGTKTLHHLLPDLVPPIDREWTGRFFEWSLNDFQNRQRQIFDEGFRAFVEMARKVDPSQYVGEGWRTSATKLLDNALIGYMLDQEGTVARPPSPLDFRGMSTPELLDLQDLITAELRARQ